MFVTLFAQHRIDLDHNHKGDRAIWYMLSAPPSVAKSLQVSVVYARCGVYNIPSMTRQLGVVRARCGRAQRIPCK